MNHLPKFFLGLLTAVSAALLALMSGCSSPPPPRPAPPIVQPPAPLPPPLVYIEPDPVDLITFRSEATTAQPAAIASTATSPNDSGCTEGTTTTSAQA